jgi:predicted DCC family thiol-disulfide oxidoreductase YuxK
MRALFVVYDSRCGLCTQLKQWLERQPAYLPIRAVAAGSEEALRRFPGMDSAELVVVSDTGEAWLGDHAWIMCLWAMRDYRQWANRLARPALRPFSRQAFAALSRSRFMLSRLLGFQSEAELQRQLSTIAVPPCRIQI